MKLFEWLKEHETEVAWFLIGFLINDGLVKIGQGNLNAAGLDFVVAAINYFMWRR
jgi:hypothetical protein